MINALLVVQLVKIIQIYVQVAIKLTMIFCIITFVQIKVVLLDIFQTLLLENVSYALKIVLNVIKMIFKNVLVANKIFTLSSFHVLLIAESHFLVF